MTMKVLGYATQAPEDDLKPFHFERRSPRTDDVLIEIHYCGVCHSDLHLARNDWNSTTYPIVPGHEIVGRVIEVGSEVTRFKPGDRVGVGVMVDSCGHCDACAQGLEQFCAAWVGTYNALDPRDQMLTYGGYSQKILVTEKFVLRIPGNLDPAGTAPLLCAGITTWSPLRHWNVGAGSKVAVVGLGGLGHMALKLAKALGAEVTLLTRSPHKEADARRLGADHIVLSGDPDQMAAAEASFDLILDTVPYTHDLNPYLPTLKIAGTLVILGLLGELDPPLNTRKIIFGRKRLAGSLIGGLAETQEMLDFCGEHGITADVEVINIEDINQAYERMLKSDVKYRFSIDMASLGNLKPGQAG